MNPKGKRLLMELGVAAAAVVILVAFVLLSQQPVTTKTPTTSPPGNGGGGGGGGTTTPPSTGGNNTTNPPVTPPTPPPIGNGKKVPPGWSHAACPKLDADIPAHGEKSRCLEQATYGALKKAGLADAQPALSTTAILRRGIPPTAGAAPQTPHKASPTQPDKSHRSQ